jgi:uracil-DNA glycosylase family 4
VTPELDPEVALAMLSWQVDLGVTEAICEAPINRYEVVIEAAKPKPAAAEITAPMLVRPDAGVAVAAAKQLAAGAQDLFGLKAAMQSFELCDLKKGARNMVFADGNPASRVMIIGDAPDRDEDREGRPFVGKAGNLLGNMLAAIGLSRTSRDAKSAVYITNAVPWRPPQDRDPSDQEMAMLTPFLLRHIELAKPEILVLMGNIACQALVGRRGIARLRGEWDTCQDLPVLPMLNPTHLLKTPAAKREAWLDLQAIRDRLKRM